MKPFWLRSGRLLSQLSYLLKEQKQFFSVFMLSALWGRLTHFKSKASSKFTTQLPALQQQLALGADLFQSRLVQRRF